jgi:nuclear transport factor 2 (NTF2) superfamily protein
MSVSRLHRFNHLFRTRTGQLIRMVDNTQFFFDKKGNVRCRPTSLAQRVANASRCARWL